MPTPAAASTRAPHASNQRPARRFVTSSARMTACPAARMDRAFAGRLPCSPLFTRVSERGVRNPFIDAGFGGGARNPFTGGDERVLSPLIAPPKSCSPRPQDEPKRETGGNMRRIRSPRECWLQAGQPRGHAQPPAAQRIIHWAARTMRSARRFVTSSARMTACPAARMDRAFAGRLPCSPLFTGGSERGVRNPFIDAGFRGARP